MVSIKPYLKIDVIHDVNKVNKLLKDGWEFIESSKTGDGEVVGYHLGLPAETRIKQLVQIIRNYEKYGYKFELFHEMSLALKEDILHYSAEGGLAMEETPLTKFMKMYEEAVNNKEVTFYKREKHPYDELDDDDFAYDDY